MQPIVKLNEQTIPQVLKDLNQWVVWKYREEPNRKKPTKPPYNAKTRQFASVTNPETLSDFNTAVKAVKDYDFAGIGLCLIEGDNLVGIDLDHIINPETKEIDYRANEILGQFKGTYAEVSPSGEGIRIWCYGKAKRTGKCNDTEKFLEIYDCTSPRYLSCTGAVLTEQSTDITEQQTALDWLHAKYMEKPNSEEKEEVPQVREESDETVLNKIRTSGNCSAFIRLHGGDLSDYDDDHSSADLAYCNILAHSGAQADQIDRIFRTSGLMRDKWLEKRGNETYGQMTIRKALEGARQEEGDNTDKKKGNGRKRKPTMAYAVDWLTNTEPFNTSIALNKFTGKIEKRKALPYTDGNAGLWTDRDDLELILQIGKEQALTQEYKKDTIANAITVFSGRNGFNPAQDSLNEYAKNWDGISRLNSWLVDLLHAEQSTENEEYLSELGTKWLIGVVARVMQPGCKRDDCLVLVGSQGVGKSRFAQLLADAIAPNAYTDSLTELDSEEAKRSMAGTIICELAELAAMRKSEVESVKRFLTTRQDRYRNPYGRYYNDYPRTVSFIATTNELDGFLKDTTGNRRFWVVTLMHDADMENIKAALPQLLGEACYRFKQGETWYTTDTTVLKQAEAIRDQHREVDLWEDTIAKRLASKRGYDELNKQQHYTTVGDCFNWLSASTGTVPGEKSINKADQMRMARVLRAIGYTTQVIRVGDKTAKVWVPDPKKFPAKD